LVRIGPTAWPFTGFIHTYIHTDRQLDKYILDSQIITKVEQKTKKACHEIESLRVTPVRPNFIKLLATDNLLILVVI
jgi:hypothetical protein